MVRLRERATGLHCHSSVVVGSRAGIETHIGSNELSINLLPFQDLWRRGTVVFFFDHFFTA